MSFKKKKNSTSIAQEETQMEGPFIFVTENDAATAAAPVAAITTHSYDDNDDILTDASVRSDTVSCSSLSDMHVAVVGAASSAITSSSLPLQDAGSVSSSSANDIAAAAQQPQQQNSGKRRQRPNRRPAPLHIDEEEEDDDDVPLDEIILSQADIELCQRLDAEYEQALEEREISYTARSQSVRQSAGFSVVFMLIYLSLGSIFFLNQADWTVADSLLFSIYTITTVGYGNLEHPDTPSFQLYTIFFIFIGIATLTIMVAQVYQCLSLEASRAQHARDKSEMARRGMEVLLRRSKEQQTAAQRADDLFSRANAVRSQARQAATNLIEIHLPVTVSEQLWNLWERARLFFSTHEIGRGLSVLFPFLGLIFIGATVIGWIEQWTWVESFYFAVVSLTTVGFGDYYPTRTASIWFCICWLPFSVGFMSLYLSNVAAFYIRLSDRNVDRIERQLRRQMERIKLRLMQEQEAARRRALRGQGGGGNNRQPEQPRIYVAAQSPTAKASAPEREPSLKEGVDDVDAAVEMVPTTSSSPQKKQHHDDTDAKSHKSSGSSPGQRLAAQANRMRGFNQVPTNELDAAAAINKGSSLFGSVGSPKNRRQIILINSRNFYRNQAVQQQQQHQQPHRQPQRRYSDDSMDAVAAAVVADDDANSHASGVSGVAAAAATTHVSATMSTMRDVLAKIRRNFRKEEASKNAFRASSGPASEFLSIRSKKTVQNRLEKNKQTLLKPSFALRALVQERFSQIIATDIAGYSSNIEIEEDTLSVTINTLRLTADKWLIPRRARKAFRAVTFEALYFVGEHGLVTRGADALFDLTPFEFHRLFAPLLAALGDAETMEGWLASTDVLTETEFGGDSIGGAGRVDGVFLLPQQRQQDIVAVGNVGMDEDTRSLPSVT